jgi:hypothetical protein
MVTLASRCSNLCKDKNFWSACYRHLHVVEIFIFGFGTVNLREINKKCLASVILKLSCKFKFPFCLVHVIFHFFILTNLLFT